MTEKKTFSSPKVLPPLSSPGGVAKVKRTSIAQTDHALDEETWTAGNADLHCMCFFYSSYDFDRLRASQSPLQLSRNLKLAALTTGSYQYLVSGGADGFVRVWSDKKQVQCYEIPGSVVNVCVTSLPTALLKGYEHKAKLHAEIPVIASCHDGSCNSIHVWDCVSQNILHTFKHHTAKVRTVLICSQNSITKSDSPWLFSGSFDNTVRFFNLCTGEIMGCIDVSTGASISCVNTCIVRSAETMKDGTVVPAKDELYILAGLEDGDIARYKYSEEAAAKMFHVAPAGQEGSQVVWEELKFQGHSDSINAMCLLDYKPQVVDLAVDYRNMLLSASEDKTIIMWDILWGKELRCFEGHTKEVQCLAITSWVIGGMEELVLVTGGWDHTIRFWDVHNGNCVKTVTAQVPVENLVTSHSYNSDNAMIGGNCITYISGNSFVSEKVNAHKSCFISSEVFGEKKITALCLGLRVNMYYNTKFVAFGRKVMGTCEREPTIDFEGKFDDDIVQLCFSSVYLHAMNKEKTDILVGLNSSKVFIWDVLTGMLLNTLPLDSRGNRKEVGAAICVSVGDNMSEDSFLVIVSPGNIRIYSFWGEKEILINEEENKSTFKYIQGVTCVASERDIVRFGSLNDDGSDDDTPKAAANRNMEVIHSLRIAIGGRRDGSVLVYHLEIFQELPEQGGDDVLGSLTRMSSTSMSGSFRKKLMSSSPQLEQVRIIGKHQIIKGHQGVVNCIQFHGARMLVSGSADGTVRLCPRIEVMPHGVPYYREKHILRRHRQFVVLSLYIFQSSDDSYLVVGGDDKIVYVWKLSSRCVIRQLMGHTSEIATVAVNVIPQRLLMKRSTTTLAERDECFIITVEKHVTMEWDMYGGRPSEEDLEFAFADDIDGLDTTLLENNSGPLEEVENIKFRAFHQVIGQHVCDAIPDGSLDKDQLDDLASTETVSLCLAVYGASFFVKAVKFKMWSFIDKFLPLCPEVLLKQSLQNIEVHGLRSSYHEGIDLTLQTEYTAVNENIDEFSSGFILYDMLMTNRTWEQVYRRRRPCLTNIPPPDKCSMLCWAIFADNGKTVGIILDAWLTLLNTTPVDAFSQIYLPSYCLAKYDLLLLGEKIPAEYERFMSSLKMIRSNSIVMRIPSWGTVPLRNHEIRYDGVHSIQDTKGLWGDQKEFDKPTDTYGSLAYGNRECKKALTDTYFHPLAHCADEALLLTSRSVCNKLDRIDLFSNFPFQVALKYSWKKYGRLCHINSFWKYICFMTTFIVASVLYGYISCDNPGSGVCGTYYFVFSFPSQIMVLIFTLYMLFEESVQFYYGSNYGDWTTFGYALLEHISDVWNLLDLVSYITVMVGTLLRVMSNSESNESRCFIAVGAVLLWIKNLYFFRAFPSTGHLVAVVVRISTDILPFVAILSVVVFGFAHAFWILSNEQIGEYTSGDACCSTENCDAAGCSGVCSDYECSRVPFSNLPDSLLRSFAFLTGEFAYQDFESSVSGFSVLLCIVYMALVTILLLNLLIALMGHGFEDIVNRARTQYHWEVSSALMDAMYQVSVSEVERFEPLVIHILTVKDSVLKNEEDEEVIDLMSNRVITMEAEIKSVNKRLHNQELLLTKSHDLIAQLLKEHNTTKTAAVVG